MSSIFYFVFYVLLLHNVINAKPPTKIEPLAESSAMRVSQKTPGNMTSRIIGGYAAYDFQFPWIANIEMDKKYMCGGTLISSRHVLTSALQREGYSKIDVLLFNGDFNNRRGESAFFSIRTIIYNDAYPDISILELPSAVMITDKIHPIRLPALSQVNNDFYGMEAVVAGWGRVDEESTTANGFLKYATVKIMSNYECSKSLNGIQSYMMCAKGYGHACGSDVGGPLQMIDNDGGWTLIGTATHYVPNKCSSFPSVYTRITSCLRWIAKVAGINLRP